MGKPDFKFFDWNMYPIGKYKQPEPNSHSTGTNGYPEKDVNKYVVKKQMQGAGAATKGTTFSECKED